MNSPYYISKCPSDLINLNNIHLNIVNSCGYCSEKKTWVTSGFSSPQMSCETYQLLLEKGWRRCGTYYYKPDLSKCCCKPYSIRLEAQKYRFRGSHLQSLKKFGNFIKKQYEPPIAVNPDPPNYDQVVQNLLEELFEAIRQNLKISGQAVSLMKPDEIKKIKVQTPNLKTKKFQKTTNLFWLIYVLNEESLKSAKIDFKCFREILADFIDDFMKQKNSNFLLECHHSGYMSVKLKEKPLKKIRTQEFIESILNDPTSNFEIKIVPATYEDESFEVYRKYSKEIHGINESRNSYETFLCQQALDTMEFMNLEADLPDNLKYGCFHMKYYYSKKLIAVGVIDVLPKGISSVYFFYDPEFKRHSLGVIGCLKEISLVLSMNKLLPKFQFYYLGYYIQSSKKMKYKGDFEPAELLCPKSLRWVPLNHKTKGIINEKRMDPSLVEEDEKETKKKDELTKDYFLTKKRLFFMDEWLSLGELQSKYINHYLENMLGLGRELGRDAMEKLEFAMI